MKQSFSKIRNYAIAHKTISLLALVIVLGIGYFIYGKMTSASTETRYVTALAKKDTIISTVSASGQVSATNQLDVKAKVSGNITWVAVKPGQAVYAGQVLATIDNTNAKN